MTDETQQAQNGASQNPDLSNLAANLAKGKPNLFSDLTGLQKTALFAVPTAIAGGIIGILIFLLEPDKLYKLSWATRDLYGYELMTYPIIAVAMTWFFTVLIFFALVRRKKLEVK